MTETEMETKDERSVETVSRRSVIAAMTSVGVPALLASDAAGNSIGETTNTYPIAYVDQITLPPAFLPNNPDEGTIVVENRFASTL